jgi:hypothetical protein
MNAASNRFHGRRIVAGAYPRRAFSFMRELETKPSPEKSASRNVERIKIPVTENAVYQDLAPDRADSSLHSALSVIILLSR